MMRRLVAAFLLGGLVLGTLAAFYYQGRDDHAVELAYANCDVEIDKIVDHCREQIDKAELWSARYYCRLRECEELIEQHYPEWPGIFSPEDRIRFDEMIDCEGRPELAPFRWDLQQ